MSAEHEGMEAVEDLARDVYGAILNLDDQRAYKLIRTALQNDE